ncbi:MAG: hypothetical protein ACK5HY_08960 [Parahaliea sp.]
MTTGWKGYLVGCAVLAVAGCSSTHGVGKPGAGTEPPLAKRYLPVEVVFDEEGCPLSLKPAVVELSRRSAEGVEWRAVGNENANFDVYFDPFGVSAASMLREKHVVKSGPVARGAPATRQGIEYKYTILGTGCPQKPLAPLIIVRD